MTTTQKIVKFLIERTEQYILMRDIALAKTLKKISVEDLTQSLRQIADSGALKQKYFIRDKCGKISESHYDSFDEIPTDEPLTADQIIIIFEIVDREKLLEFAE